MMRRERFTEGAPVILSGDRASAGTSVRREGIWGGANLRAGRDAAGDLKVAPTPASVCMR